MPTCVLKTQVKEAKTKIKIKFYIENIPNFEPFNTLNTKFSIKTFYIKFLNIWSKDTS